MLSIIICICVKSSVYAVDERTKNNLCLREVSNDKERGMFMH